MPDQTVVTTPPAEEKKDPTLLEEVRGKSFNQILREQAEARQKATSGEDDSKTQETEEEKKKKEEDEKAAKEAEEAKRKVEEEEAAKKRDAEIAKQAADEVLRKQEEEKKAAEEKAKAEEEAKKREEALKPKFTGKDKDGKVVPKDYDELALESARIGKEQALKELEEKEAAKAAADKKAQEDKEAAEKAQKERQVAIEAELQKQMDADLTAMYAAGDMPKVKDPKDENDPGNKEFKHLLETAQKVNADLIAKGQKPIMSLQVIRYGKGEDGKPYYTPLVTKPAGHDAPVLGSESPISHEAPDDKYVVSRDRHKSVKQIMREVQEAARKKLNVRGA